MNCFPNPGGKCATPRLEYFDDWKYIDEFNFGELEKPKTVHIWLKKRTHT
jgi:hypothetical protein